MNIIQPEILQERSAFLPQFSPSIPRLRVGLRNRFSTSQSLCLSVQLDLSICLFGCYCLSVCISVSSYFNVSVFRSAKSFKVWLLISLLFVHLSFRLLARACFYLQVAYIYQSLSAHLSVDYTACAPTTEQELSNYFQRKQKLPVTLTIGPQKL